MKKRTRIIGLILALTLVITSFAGTAAFADEVTPSTITFTDGFEEVHAIDQKAIKQFEVEISNPDATLTAQSSDAGILSVNLQADPDEPGDYTFSLTAWEEGDATITFTTSDGATATQDITVGPAGEPIFTVSSDVTGDFSVAKGSSRIVKVHYESDDLDHISFPVLTTDDQENTLQTQLIDMDYDNNDFYFRVDAVGDDGQTGKLYLGSSDYIPDYLCTVTVKENQDLRLDTTVPYICNTYDTYRFVVYTSSATAPEVSAYNDLITIEPVGKVTGGYEYRLEAEEEGESLVQVSLNGENASFPVIINYNDPPIVKTEMPETVTLAKGSSATYKINIMGGGEPQLAADTTGVVSTQLTKKEGPDYYFTVTALGDEDATTKLYLTFPDTNDDDFNVDLSDLTVTAPVGVIMTSDTNTNFSVKQGASYTFKITGATSFYAGSSGVFKTEQVGKTADGGTLYKITATGPGGPAGRILHVCPQSGGTKGLCCNRCGGYSG